ncbi:MAG: hypothetical protein M3R30_09355, partial [Candidatus Eremiobacteraeota bacterium]|nr:hypothetical protein [Candidatus Eremiobacteraeota bacterium]
MDPSEAREHLDLVDRILTRSDENVCLVGDIFVVWGIASALTDLIFQLIISGKIAEGWQWVSAASLICAVLYTIIRVRRGQRSLARMTLAARDYVNVLWVVFGLTAVAQVGAYHFFVGWTAPALWTLAASILTWYIALSGRNVFALIGGCVLVVSLIAASYVALPGYVLAGGMLLGYA